MPARRSRTPKTAARSRGGGKKPWRQKGTGRARHGSIRSPIWKGGGVTHGPLKEKDYSRAIPKKMRAKALFIALSKKLSDGEIIFVDSFGIDDAEDRDREEGARHTCRYQGFEKLSRSQERRALIALADPKEATIKSFRNIERVETKPVRDLNPVTVLKYRYLVIENPEASVAIMANRTKRNSNGSNLKNKILWQSSAAKRRASNEG